MTDDLRNILDPASAFSDEDVMELLSHAQKKKVGVWPTIMFFRRHNQLNLAMDWLREQGDKKLCKLADVLPGLFAQLDEKHVTPTVVINRNDQTVQQTFKPQSKATVVNL